ncbi:MAG TPA: glycosyltransferase, partial [Candidatus Binatia bacterium]|nr:glycosyltransferase [Candidatus Binatia bacterium]
MIPSYNQRERTRRAVVEAAATLAALPGERTELIVVDDGSQAGNGIQAEDMPPGAVFVGLRENQGKGGAVRAGMARAQGDCVIFTDSDLPFSLEPLATTLAWLRADADIVIGDRLHPESSVTAPVGPLRRLSSAVYTW